MFLRARLFGSLFSLFLIALAVRAIRYPTIFSKAGVQLPFAGDAYYHLRRIWFSVTRFPESLPFDRYVSFPDGSQIIWPGAFDWTIAALIRPFVEPNDQYAVEAIAVWAPAVLGAVTTGLVALLAARFYGRSAGWWAGLIYAFLPMSITFSQLGMIDHHVAVALLSLLMLWLSCEIFALDDRAETWATAIAAPSTRLNGVLGALMAIILLTWPGSLLHIVVLQLAFCLRWLWLEDRDRARTAAVGFSVGQAIIAVCVAPFTLGMVWREYGAWSPMVLSNFQPFYFASAALTVGIVQLLHEYSPLGDSRGRRFLSSVVLALFGLFVALLLLPAMRDALLYAGGWFGEGGDVLGSINELQPILARYGRFDLRFPVEMFGAGFVVLPITWLYLVWRAIADRSAPHGLILFWSVAFIALTLQQWRFGNTLSVAYAVLTGAVLGQWFSNLRRRSFSRPLRPVAEIVVVCVLFAWTTRAFIHYFSPVVRNSLAALSDEQLRMKGPLRPVIRIHDEAGRWIGQHTPKTSGYLDPASIPEYAVLAMWARGHLLRYRAERPMIQDNFGPYAGLKSFEAAAAYFAERDETAAIGILDQLGVRYVIGGPMGSGSIRGLGPHAMVFRLGRAFGSSVILPPDRRVLGLARHRLIFYSHSAPPHVFRAGLRVPLPHHSLGVWEIVPGARIEGRARPSGPVRLALKLKTSSGSTHFYRRQTLADAEGNYHFVVPYPTDVSFSPDVRVIGAYWLKSSKSRAKVLVREEDVIVGEVVRVSDF